MILFFYGPNTFALRQKLRETIAAYVAKTGSDFGLERIDGATAKPDQLRAALTAVPFLATSRLVIIEDLGKNKAAAEKIADLVKLIPATTVVVMVETAADQRTTYFKQLTKLAKTAQFEQLTRPQLINWATREVERLGGTVDRATVTELVELTNGDQWRLSEEINKLVNFSSEVTRDSVRQLVEPGLVQTAFDLVEAMTGGRVDGALGVYHALLRAREDPLKLLGLIQWQLRNLLLAKTAGQIQADELARSAAMAPYVAGKMIMQARRFDEATLIRAYREAVDTEEAVKTGAVTAELGVEQLIYRTAAAWR